MNLYSSGSNNVFEEVNNRFGGTKDKVQGGHNRKSS